MCICKISVVRVAVDLDANKLVTFENKRKLTIFTHKTIMITEAV